MTKSHCQLLACTTVCTTVFLVFPVVLYADYIQNLAVSTWNCLKLATENKMETLSCKRLYDRFLYTNIKRTQMSLITLDSAMCVSGAFVCVRLQNQKVWRCKLPHQDTEHCASILSDTQETNRNCIYEQSTNSAGLGECKDIFNGALMCTCKYSSFQSIKYCWGWSTRSNAYFSQYLYLSRLHVNIIKSNHKKSLSHLFPSFLTSETYLLVFCVSNRKCCYSKVLNIAKRFCKKPQR